MEKIAFILAEQMNLIEINYENWKSWQNAFPLDKPCDCKCILHKKPCFWKPMCSVSLNQDHNETWEAFKLELAAVACCDIDGYQKDG